MQIFKGNKSVIGIIERPQKLTSLQFIRIVCAVGIILYHVSVHTEAEAQKYFINYANGGYGELFVGIFLLMSGGVLYYNYKEIPSLKGFYYKRWKSIFPTFYVIWFYYYLDSAISYRSVFYKGIPAMFFTVFGMDGYFAYRFDTYYKVGEWFLGALVFMYALYPLFAKIVNKFKYWFLLILVPLWIWQVNTDIFIIPPTINLIYISLVFVTGMLIFKYRLFNNVYIKSASVITSAILLFVPLNINVLYTNYLTLISLFFTVYFIGEYVVKVKIFEKVTGFLGDLTFPVYLLQNTTVLMILHYIQPDSAVKFTAVSVVALAVCVLHSWYVKAIVKALTNTKWFKKLDEFFLNNKQSLKGDKNGPDKSN